ncbi:MAG: hypothetical protein OEX02_01675 [Cyclobacteriaceae bacterium]|nr:hypothetical protein [Cyclobacteriaceae bacterium]
MLSKTIIQYKTKSLTKRNSPIRRFIPYAKAERIGVVFCIEGLDKHQTIKEFIRQLEMDGKSVKSLGYLPKGAENHEFRFDFFTEKDVNAIGQVTKETITEFINIPFDYLYCIDSTPNIYINYILARSKAKCRIGLHDGENHPYFELMIKAGRTPLKILLDEMLRYSKNLNE